MAHEVPYPLSHGFDIFPYDSLAERYPEITRDGYEEAYAILKDSLTGATEQAKAWFQRLETPEVPLVFLSTLAFLPLLVSCTALLF